MTENRTKTRKAYQSKENVKNSHISPKITKGNDHQNILKVQDPPKNINPPNLPKFTEKKSVKNKENTENSQYTICKENSCVRMTNKLPIFKREKAPK